MKIAAVVLLTAFILTPLVHIKCSRLDLERQEIDELKEQVVKLEEKIIQYEVANNNLQARIIQYEVANKRLQDEKATALALVQRLTTKAPVSEMSFQVNFKDNELHNEKESKTIASMVLEFAKKNNYDARITIDGYASAAGTAEYNEWVSNERAKNVMQKIISIAGKDANKLKFHVVAHGETNGSERKVVITVEVL